MARGNRQQCGEARLLLGPLRGRFVHLCDVWIPLVAKDERLEALVVTYHELRPTGLSQILVINLLHFDYMSTQE